MRHAVVTGETTCFITLARSLRIRPERRSFRDKLARSIPLKFLARHCDDPGCNWRLCFSDRPVCLTPPCIFFDEYYQLLCREYYFLARKYGLRPMRRDVWKYARTRPWNFPHRRIATLAAAVTGGFALFSDIMERSGEPQGIAALFHWPLQGYWATHSDFDVEAARLSSCLSESSVRLLLINFCSSTYICPCSLTR